MKQAKPEAEEPQASENRPNEILALDPRLAAAIKIMETAEKLPLRHTDKKTGKVTISNYTKVASRVEAFRKAFGVEPEFETEIIERNDQIVVMRAVIKIDGRTVAMGHAEERRSIGPVNKTAALENCETSAIGRALGNLGLHGGEYATLEERETAIEDQRDLRREARHGTSLPKGPQGGRTKPPADAFVLHWPDGDVREFARSRRMIDLWLTDCLRATSEDADILMANLKALEWVEETATRLEKPDWNTRCDEIRDVASNPIEGPETDTPPIEEQQTLLDAG